MASILERREETRARRDELRVVERGARPQQPQVGPRGVAGLRVEVLTQVVHARPSPRACHDVGVDTRTVLWAL
jgi:hypothetical protein